MKFLKKIRKSSSIRRLAALLITAYHKLVWITSRWEFIGKEYPTPYWQEKKPMIACFWHGRLLMMFKAWFSHQKLHMLISSHPDGEIIGRVCQHLGYGAIPGSSTRGGKEAFLTILRALKKGESVGVTPDGPRGPRYHVSPGIIKMARLSKTPILPIAYSVKRGIFMKTWDRFLLPFPFTKGVFIYGPVLDVAASSKSDEDLQQELETTLRQLTQTVDHVCGWGTE